MNITFVKYGLPFIFLAFPACLFSQQKLYTSGSSKTKNIILPDGTKVSMNTKTSVRLAPDFGVKQRTVWLKGEAFFTVVPYRKQQFIIRTGQLIINTREARIQIDAYPDAGGEEADVLSGNVKVKKSYYSKLDNEQYSLNKGEMVMINRGIDLIEKEKFDSTQLKNWPGK